MTAGFHLILDQVEGILLPVVWHGTHASIWKKWKALTFRLPGSFGYAVPALASL